MGTSKIMIDGVGIDLTADTVAAGNMLSSVKAHDANGDIVTGTIPSQGAQTINPALSPQTISAGKYLSGNQTVAAITKELLASLDADFVAGNIKKDVDLFGLVGTLEGGGDADFFVSTITPATSGEVLTVELCPQGRILRLLGVYGDPQRDANLKYLITRVFAYAYNSTNGEYSINNASYYYSGTTSSSKLESIIQYIGTNPTGSSSPGKSYSIWGKYNGTRNTELKLLCTDGSESKYGFFIGTTYTIVAYVPEVST